MTCIKESYMEYSIMTTNSCNLQCIYCINSERRRQKNLKADTGKIISYIKDNVNQHHYDFEICRDCEVKTICDGRS